MPKISICIPTYNRACLLEETIECALAQTTPDSLEILVIDNASTDNTADVISNLHDERIRYIRNSVNLGMTANWNRCLELASGEYLTIWSDDDIYDPSRIQEQVAVLDSHAQVGLVYTAHSICDQSGQPVREAWPFPQAHVWDGFVEMTYLARRCYMYSPLMRRRHLEQVGTFNTQLKYAHDWEMWLRFALCGQVGYVNKPLMAYRIHAQQESAFVEKRNFVLAQDWCLALESAFAHAPLEDRQTSSLKKLGYCEIAQIYLWQTWKLIQQGDGRAALLSFRGAMYALGRTGGQFVPYSIRDGLEFCRKRKANKLKYAFWIESS